MEKELEMVMEKTKKIIAGEPPYAKKNDKIMALSRKFRLGRKDSEMLLRRVERFYKC